MKKYELRVHSNSIKQIKIFQLAINIFNTAKMTKLCYNVTAAKLTNLTAEIKHQNRSNLNINSQ